MSRSNSAGGSLSRSLEHWSRRDFIKRAGGATAVLAFTSAGFELLEACGGQTNPSTTGGTPVEGGHVIEAVNNDPYSFNPMLVIDFTSQIVSGLCFEGLLTSLANGDQIPGIAQALPQTSSDLLTHTFKLRTDVKWTDGKPVTADDVVFTYQLGYDPAYKSVNFPYRGAFETYLRNVKAVDPYTVVFEMKRPYAPFVTLHGQYGILPKHILGNLPPDQINTADFTQNGPNVVSGVFKFVKWDKGQQVVLERNESYFRGKSHLAQYVLKVLPDSVAQANQLRSGEADASVIDPSLVDSFKGSSSVNIVEYSSALVQQNAYQMDPSKSGSKFFADKAVRQALLFALDRQKMIDVIYFGQATVAASIEPPVTFGYNPSAKPAYTYDVAKAEALLDGAGWKKGASGIREKNGVQLKFELMSITGIHEYESAVVVIQEQLKKIGVVATPKLVSIATIGNVVTNTRDFDMMYVGFLWQQDPDASQYYASTSNVTGGKNFMGYSNPQVDQLLSQAVATTDRSQRKQLYFQIQDILQEDLPTPPLMVAKAVWGVNKRVRNFNLGTFDSNTSAARPWMKDVYVTDGK